MDTLNLEQLKMLARQTQMPSISIYQPTHRAFTEQQQDIIRFKNLIQRTERQFEESGMKPREIETLLQPAHALLEDSFFWQRQYDGLAVFIAAGDFHYYRLPFNVEEQLVIARSYYIKPILPLFTGDGHYYILAISLNSVRLFEGTRYTIGQIDLPEGIPTSIDEALQFDVPEKQLQFRSGSAGAVIFHGQGPGDEEQKVRIERYLNKLDAGLRKIFADQRAPLVLAGVDYLLPIYRKVSEYAHLMPDGITGNPEHLRAEDLQKRAWPIVEPYFRQEIEKTVEQYRQLINTEHASDDLEVVVSSAFYGRVDKLLLAADASIWGVFDAETGTVAHFQKGQSKPDELPLLDFAAMQTLDKGGSVYALSRGEMPTESPVAAVLRY